MKNTPFLIALSLFAFSGCGIFKIKPEVPQFNDRVYVLGPEVQPFCGGTVELWATMDTTSWKRDVVLNLKVSAGGSADGESGGFEVSNEHLLVEIIQDGAVARRRKLKDIKALEFSSSTTLDTSGSSNVGKWELTAEGLDPNTGVKVFLKPFKGCKGQQAVVPVVLRERTIADLNLD